MALSPFTTISTAEFRLEH